MTVTKLLPASADAIHEAAGVLRSGGLVAFPTETVYGLGADAQNPAAVRSMFAAKGRPADHPVIVHLAEASWLQRYAPEVPSAAWQLATAFWPGPMTLVLKRNERIGDLVTGGLETVGLRVPSHPVAQLLLQAFDGPIAAPSANRFGRVSATAAAHVLSELEGYVDLILDGGPCQVGLESTIIDLSTGDPAILRPGAITRDEVESVLGHKLASPAHRPRVSGSLPSHYAPRARVEIVTESELEKRASDLAAQGMRVAMITPNRPMHLGQNIVHLDCPLSIEDLAHSLYALLREVDQRQCEVALVTLPLEQGLGVAIADRLRRAAGLRQNNA